MTGRMTIAILAVLLGTVAVLVWAQRGIRREPGEGYRGAPPSAVTLAGNLPDGLRETSGVAVSRAHPGVIWTHNDSGDGPFLYAVDGSAALLGVWSLLGAEARDWEDIDLAGCPDAPDRDCLYVGDTGDNQRRRDALTVYVVPEPDPTGGGREVPATRLRYRYPDEPHDAEAVAVGPGGELVIVTKGRSGAILLFVLDRERVLEATRADTVVTLPPGRMLPFGPDFRSGRQVTGAGFDARGETLAVRTYTELFFYRWPVDDAWTEARLPCLLAGVDRGGEGVAFLEDGSLLLSAEAGPGRPASLTRIRCREETDAP